MNKNHRCKGSLEAEVSITYDYPYKIFSKGEKKEWRLFCYNYDSEYDTYIKKHVCKINICPFCGEVLKD